MIVMANTFIFFAIIILELQFYWRSKLTNSLIKIMHILEYETKRFNVNILLQCNEEIISKLYYFTIFKIAIGKYYDQQL